MKFEVKFLTMQVKQTTSGTSQESNSQFLIPGADCHFIDKETEAQGGDLVGCPGSHGEAEAGRTRIQVPQLLVEALFPLPPGLSAELCSL